jgi:hypothetical protein
MSRDPARVINGGPAQAHVKLRRGLRLREPRPRDQRRRLLLLQRPDGVGGRGPRRLSCLWKRVWCAHAGRLCDAKGRQGAVHGTGGE